MSEKNFYIFAGVNGAGKSSLYKLTSTFDKNSDFGERINTDEIVNKIGNWKNAADQIKASKMAIKMRKDFIKKGISFNQETTLTGNTILKAIEEAKKNGYKILMAYVGVENPEIAKDRVKIRVNKGGHDIPAEKIEERYYKSLENLKKIAMSCDKLVVYDNSKVGKAPTRYFIQENDSITLLTKELPKWVNDLKINLEDQLEKKSLKEIKDQDILSKQPFEEVPKDDPWKKKLENDKAKGLSLGR